MNERTQFLFTRVIDKYTNTIIPFYIHPEREKGGVGAREGARERDRLRQRQRQKQRQRNKKVGRHKAHL